MSSILLNRNPLDIEGLWHDMYQCLHYHGYAGSEMRAISAIDIALWDILGQVTNQPVYRLLGGKCRDDIRIYNTCVSHGQYFDRENFINQPGKLAEDLLKEGISAMKIWPFDDFSIHTRGQSISKEDMEKDVGVIREIRESVGDNMDIALEGHSCWNLPTAIRIANAVEPYDLMWLEDLITPDNIGSLVDLRQSTKTPLCVSERLFSRFQYLPVLEQRAADIIMPDICWVGGISEIKKIATLSSSYQLPIAPHNCGGPIQTLAYSHVCVSTENVLILETVRSFYHTYYEEIITNIPEIKNGYLYPNDLPGIGTKLSPKFLNSSDVIRKESKHVNTSLGWTSGDPWNGDVGNKF